MLINLGGDLAFIGIAPTTAPAGPSASRTNVKPVGDPDRVIRMLEFPDGPTTAGVATSTTLKRRWAQGRRHHVIDPRTGA